LPNVGPYIYTTLAFLALLGAPYIYDISSLRVKLTEVFITNYGKTIKSISTLMYTVWHVDKYKITFKLVINWTNEIL